MQFMAPGQVLAGSEGQRCWWPRLGLRDGRVLVLSICRAFCDPQHAMQVVPCIGVAVAAQFCFLHGWMLFAMFIMFQIITATVASMICKR